MDIIARGLALQAKALIGSPANASNANPAVLPIWRKALGNVLAGTGYATVACIGDSTTMGAGAGSSGTSNTTGARANSYPALLKKLLNGMGIPAIDENTWGDNTTPGGGTAGITSYDPRVTFTGTSWSRTATALAGALFTNAATSNTDALIFTPTTPCDTFVIWYVQNSGFPTFTVTDGGTTLATINAAGSAAFPGQIVTRASATTNPISIQKSSGTGTFYIGGIDAYNSATKSVRLFNWGTYGSWTTNWTGAGSPWSTLNAIQLVKPSLSIIQLGINDIRNNVSAATYQANMQSLINACKANGDVILLRFHPDNAPANASLLPGYSAAQSALSVSNNIPLIDLTARFGSYSAMSSVYWDSVHLLPAGNADVASAVLGVLRPH